MYARTSAAPGSAVKDARRRGSLHNDCRPPLFNRIDTIAEEWPVDLGRGSNGDDKAELDGGLVIPPRALFGRDDDDVCDDLAIDAASLAPDSSGVADSPPPRLSLFGRDDDDYGDDEVSNKCGDRNKVNTPAMGRCGLIDGSVRPRRTNDDEEDTDVDTEDDNDDAVVDDASDATLEERRYPHPRTCAESRFDRKRNFGERSSRLVGAGAGTITGGGIGSSPDHDDGFGSPYARLGTKVRRLNLSSEEVNAWTRDGIGRPGSTLTPGARPGISGVVGRVSGGSGSGDRRDSFRSTRGERRLAIDTVPSCGSESDHDRRSGDEDAKIGGGSDLDCDRRSGVGDFKTTPLGAAPQLRVPESSESWDMEDDGSVGLGRTSGPKGEGWSLGKRTPHAGGGNVDKALHDADRISPVEVTAFPFSFASPPAALAVSQPLSSTLGTPPSTRSLSPTVPWSPRGSRRRRADCGGVLSSPELPPLRSPLSPSTSLDTCGRDAQAAEPLGSSSSSLSGPHQPLRMRLGGMAGAEAQMAVVPPTPIPRRRAVARTPGSTTPCRCEDNCICNPPGGRENSAAAGRFSTDFDILGRPLGDGCFGTVYSARSRLDGVEYAVKVAKRGARGEYERRRMLQEVQALATLCDQPDPATFHIVRYHQAWMEEDRLHIQTELCDSTLDVYSIASSALPGIDGRGGIPEETQYRLLREMSLALELLHRSGMVHLDIKPENIFIKKDQFKLGDFGLVSKIANSGDVEEGDSRYMSLELLSGDHHDLTKCDIFSLGATMYQIFQGRSLPSDGPDWHELRSGRLSPTPHTPAALRSIVRDMMKPEPSDRPSASELLRNRRLLSAEERMLITEKNRATEARTALAAMQDERMTWGKLPASPAPGRRGALVRHHTWNGG